MTCPVCNEKLKCVESRPRNHSTYRRYMCPKCGQRYTTTELFENSEYAPPLKVSSVKKVITVPKMSQKEIKDRLEHPWKYK
jgi:transcriptional regulator NrdR family protein